MSLGTQLFFTQLINTGFVYLLVNTHFSTDVEWLAIGSYTDFSASWFSTVGVSIMVTMGLNIVFPHLTPIMRLCLDSCKRRWDRTCLKPGRVTKKKTQAAYNKLYSQQTFRFAERYGQSLNTFVVTLCYSTGTHSSAPVPLASCAGLPGCWCHRPATVASVRSRWHHGVVLDGQGVPPAVQQDSHRVRALHACYLLPRCLLPRGVLTRRPLWQVQRRHGQTRHANHALRLAAAHGLRHLDAWQHQHRRGACRRPSVVAAAAPCNLVSVLLQDEALEAALLRTADEAGQAGAFAKDQIDAFDPGLNASTRLFANHVLPLTVLFFILAALFVLWVVVRALLLLLLLSWLWAPAHPHCHA